MQIKGLIIGRVKVSVKGYDDVQGTLREVQITATVPYDQQTVDYLAKQSGEHLTAVINRTQPSFDEEA